MRTRVAPLIHHADDFISFTFDLLVDISLIEY